MILNRSQLRIKSILIALLHLISGNYSLFPTLTLIFPYPRFTATSLHFGLCSLHLCLLCELCCLLPTHTPPKHTWVQKLNTKMQRSNFQNKTRTKQLHQNPQSHPCKQTLPLWHLFINFLPTLPHLCCTWEPAVMMLENELGRPGEADGLYKTFFDTNMNKHILVVFRALPSTEFLKNAPLKNGYTGLHWLCPHTQLVKSLIIQNSYINVNILIKLI